MEQTEKIRLFLADDHTLVREGIAALIEREPDLSVIGQCGDGLKVVEEVLKVRPDVVVLDLAMPGLNGTDICRQLSRKARKMPVLILTMYADEEFIVRALENGAAGYLVKEAAGDQLAEAVRTVARGDLYLGPGVPRNVLSRLAAGTKSDPYNKLTPREREVLQLIAEGKTNRNIAEVLGLSVKTVDTHRAHLMRKLGIHDQTTLVKFALRRGIVGLT
ncbi:MAG TPA: response regulator transcription factor [Phycisphaerae bacterium]|nr:response regulator transcription factor [Phycisphaerae bacterium]